MKKIVWLCRWSAILVFPYLVWITIVQVTRLLLPGGYTNPDLGGISVISGTLIALLAVISLGFLADRAGSPGHFANVLTGSLLANWILFDPARILFLIWPQVALPILLVAIGISITIWVHRRRRAGRPAQG